MIITIVMVPKLRLGQAKALVQGHAASRGQRGRALDHRVSPVNVWGEGLYHLENRNVVSAANRPCGFQEPW